MRYVLYVLFFFIGAEAAISQNIPGQFILQWEDDFTSEQSLKRYLPLGEVRYSILSTDTKGPVLSLISADSTSGITPNAFFLGDFVLHFKLFVPEVNELKADTFSLQFARKDSLNYYRVQFITRSDHLAITISSIQNGEFTVLESLEFDPSFLPETRWIHAGVRHDILEGSIGIWLHHAKQPVMKLNSRKLVLGGVVFHTTGSFLMDELRIYAPTVLNSLDY